MRYLLFGSGQTHYPGGGGWDFICQSDDLSELLEYPKTEGVSGVLVTPLDWWHIFDTKIGEIVLCSSQQPYGVEDYMFENMKESE